MKITVNRLPNNEDDCARDDYYIETEAGRVFLSYCALPSTGTREVREKLEKLYGKDVIVEYA